MIPLGWLPPDGEGFCYIDVAMAGSGWFPRLSAVSTCFLFLFGALFIILLGSDLIFLCRDVRLFCSDLCL